MSNQPQFDLEMEPEFEPQFEPAPEMEPVALSATEPEPVQRGPLALMQVLPADFPLPALIRFVPDPALRTAADEAARHALTIEVAGPEGLRKADVACTALRASLKAIHEHFENPADIANQLHKQITGTRSAWVDGPKRALDTVSGRVATEQRRLKQLADEERRKQQAEADRLERERRKKEAEEAARQQAPAPVVEEMKRQAETATAPPVAPPAETPTLSGSTVVTTWKARLKGTTGDQDPNPDITALTPVQRAAAMTLLRAIVDAEQPLVGIQIDWAYWNKRAKSDQAALEVPGIEAFPQEGLRAKPSRSK